jgi:sec-independent protein translocase protein TatA
MGLRDPFIWVIILVLAVLFFGTKKIPDLAKNLGQGLKEFKKATKDEGKEPPPAIASTTPKETGEEKKDEPKA